jgi:peptidoglycan-N-acetylglucosamine deacetylase
MSTLDEQTNIADANEFRAWTMFLDASEEQLVEAIRPVMATGRRLSVNSWPGNARAAVAVTFDVDNEFPMAAALPAQIGGGSYGWFQALPRIHKLLDEEDIPASFYVPVGSALICPEMIPDILKSGRHEIGLHGWTHERVPELRGIEEERRLLKQQLDWYKRAVGGLPRGYRAPNGAISADTIDLLIEAGILYDSSIPGGDDCYEALNKGKPSGMVEVPFSWILTDWMNLHVDDFYQGNEQSPDAVYKIFKAEFDAAYEEGGLYLLTLHPHVIGRRSRLPILKQIINDVKAKGDVWFATVEQIASYVAEQNGLLQPVSRPIR